MAFIFPLFKSSISVCDGELSIRDIFVEETSFHTNSTDDHCLKVSVFWFLNETDRAWMAICLKDEAFSIFQSPICVVSAYRPTEWHITVNFFLLCLKPGELFYFSWLQI